MNLEPSAQDHRDPNSPEGILIGGSTFWITPAKSNRRFQLPISTKTKEIPPFLIIHGNKDRLVPFGQSVLLYEALKQNDKSVVMYKLDGADHGGSSFWTEEVLEIVNRFLREHL